MSNAPDAAPRGPLPKLRAVNEASKSSTVASGLAMKHNREKIAEGRHTSQARPAYDDVDPNAADIIGEYRVPSKGAPANGEMTLEQLAESLKPKPVPARTPAPAQAPSRRRSGSSLAGAVLKGMKG